MGLPACFQELVESVIVTPIVNRSMRDDTSRFSVFSRVGDGMAGDCAAFIAPRFQRSRGLGDRDATIPSNGSLIVSGVHSMFARLLGFWLTVILVSLGLSARPRRPKTRPT